MIYHDISIVHRRQKKTNQQNLGGYHLVPLGNPVFFCGLYHEFHQTFDPRHLPKPLATGLASWLEKFHHNGGVLMVLNG